LNVAVVGVGHLGQHHARNYTEIEGCRLVAVADSDAERAREVARRHGVDWVPNYRDLPGDLDAVSIVTPTTTHREVASWFVDRGVHTMVEKPITDTVAEAEDLVAKARKTGVTFQVGHIERFNPAATAVEGLEVDPKFMEVHRLAPFSFRSTDVSVVKDIMIHDLDIILHFARSEVVDVRAAGFPVVTRKDDIANARLEFASGCVANVTASRLSLQPMRKIRLFTTRAYVSLDYLNKTGIVIKAPPDILEKARTLDGVDLEKAAPNIFGDLLQIEQIKMDEYEPLKKELTSFVDAIREGTEPVVTGEDGLRALDLAERIGAGITEHAWYGEGVKAE
jgi:predicted dehydrogenase